MMTLDIWIVCSHKKGFVDSKENWGVCEGSTTIWHEALIIGSIHFVDPTTCMISA
jgi:hypothetical protein